MNDPPLEFLRTDFGHKVYDSWYLEHARHNFEAPEFIEKHFPFYEKALQLSETDIILDAGCGIGSYTRAFARRGYHIVGMDLSPNFLAEAEKITQRENLEIEFVLGDYGEALQRVDNADHPAYQHFPGEVDIPVKAGDLVIGDSRLLHASHGNQSDERRTVITLWYHPFFALLPAEMQAHIGRLRQRLAWSDADWARIAELAPICKSDVEPLKWNRNPGPELR
ncbi:methyltransferase domain-containing protein [Candidatus Poribacteria bacterium]|nr:methyltransferase domain-containing protein [Candidatus Poribacteria bacterium]MYG08560.1 methyltransferase domain-containing protein [Candidatus Poribacteria bacterium]MYK21361.1 methyltransferase domain-containing protein [Candidatus Poribacteria bacterium]